jgi:hypothetical protein
VADAHRRLEEFLESVDGRSRRSLRKVLEAQIGEPDPIRRHEFAEMLVDGGGYFAEYKSIKYRGRTPCITFHGPVLHRADGAAWDPDEATRAGQQYARWLISTRQASEVLRA